MLFWLLDSERKGSENLRDVQKNSKLFAIFSLLDARGCYYFKGGSTRVIMLLVCAE